MIALALAAHRGGRIGERIVRSEPSFPRPGMGSQVLMMRRPAGRFLTMPFPPLPFAARLLAAVILPPRLFLAMLPAQLLCILSGGYPLPTHPTGPGSWFSALGLPKSPGDPEDDDSENDRDQAIGQPESLETVERRGHEDYEADPQSYGADDRPRRDLRAHRKAPRGRTREILKKERRRGSLPDFPVRSSPRPSASLVRASSARAPYLCRGPAAGSGDPWPSGGL